MTDSHWHLPGEPLRSSMIRTQLVGLAGVVAIAVAARSAFPLGSMYPVEAGAFFAVVMILALGHIDGYHPFARFGAANQITTIRLGLVALLASLIGEPDAAPIAGGAVIASSIATFLDGMDGWLSRRTATASAFGARFDMETDALLIQVLAILAWRYGKAGPWVLASGLLRYLFVAAGWLWPWIDRPLFPSLRRKTICVVQVVGLIVTIAPVVPPEISSPIAAVSLAVLCYSFFVDTLWLWRRAT